MKPTELLALLQEFYAERSRSGCATWPSHTTSGNLDFNNTYQYVINREETHLAWLRSAIEELGGVTAARRCRNR